MATIQTTRTAGPADAAPVSGLPQILSGEDETESLAEPEPIAADEGADDTYERLVEWIDDPNIARHIDQTTLDKLGAIVVEEFHIDDDTRGEWKDETKKALDFALQVTEPKQYPWPEACLSLDTDILTRTGWKPIADVRVGEEVLSRSPDGDAGFFPVTQTFRHHAKEVVHFSGKSIDLLATPNHRMFVEDRYTGAASFIEAKEFLASSKRAPYKERLASKFIPLTSTVPGADPATIYGIPTTAYVRFLGWYISEGWSVAQNGSFGIAQSQTANPEKCRQIEADLKACGFTWSRGESQTGYTVHARTMPDMLKAELRAMRGAATKCIPRHVLSLGAQHLESLLETMLAGDGSVRRRAHQRASVAVYSTISATLADDVQELCQRIGIRGTITFKEACLGGVINGRQISGLARIYHISINRKPGVQVLKLSRKLVPYEQDVACVEVFPHHTIYVRRNGKAVWTGNSNIVFPLISSAAFEFAAMAYPAIIPGRNVVKGVVWGTDEGTPATQDGKPDGPPVTDANGRVVWKVKPGAKQKRATAIGEHMSWQLLDDMEYWEEQMDTALHQLPIVGGFVKKTYRDFRENRNMSVVVDLMKVVWNKHAPSFERAPRKTEILELYPNEVEDYERDEETFIPILYGPGDAMPAESDAEAPAPDQSDSEAPYVFLEQTRRYDLDGDGYAEPLIVTVHLRTSKVVRIIANYEEEGIELRHDKTLKRIKPIECLTLFRFFPNPKGGSYPVGFGQLLKPMNEAINTTLNQLFDSGHLQIAGGGFIGAGLSMAAGPTYFSIGEYKPVNNRGTSLRENIFPMPWPGPNAVLFQVLGFLVEAGKQMASVKDALTGDSSLANTPPTTMLALVQQGMRMYTAIYKRVYRSLKSEFAKLYRLNRIYLEEDERYRVGDTWRTVTPEDYRMGGGVEPWADPTMITDMQRLTRASVLKQEAKENPLVNPLVATRRYLEAAQIDRIDEVLPAQMPPPQPNPDMMQAQAEIQLKQAALQSKVGLERAQELQAYTMAMLNFQKARSEMSGPQIEWMENQLEAMRLHIEALNTTVKAAAVDVKARGDEMHHRAAMAGHAVTHAGNVASAAQQAREIANEQPEPGPPDTGGRGAGQADLAEPGGADTDGTGLAGVAPQPRQSGLPALPGAPLPGDQGGGDGILPPGGTGGG